MSIYDRQPGSRKGRYKPHVRKLVDEARRNGARVIDISHTGRGHIKLEICGGDGRLGTLVTSATPSDWRAIHKARADLRRKFRGVPR
jgi:ribosomal protein RSM22 (predicted rRNA methylase)